METINGSMVETPRPGRPAFARWTWPAVGVLAALAVLTLYGQFILIGAVAAQHEALQAAISRADARVRALDAASRAAADALDAATDRLGAVEAGLEQARAVNARSERIHRQLDARFMGHVDQQVRQLEALTGDVGAVRTEAVADRQALRSVMGDLGVQSGLVARNRDELDALRRRGERDYFEFSLVRSDDFAAVGPVSLRLRKTDEGRQRYTLTVRADDKVVEKKDRTLLEPVQFYVPRSRSLREIVVYEIGRDTVAGYVSVPREVVALR
jgi:hypothetical protein